MTSQDNIILSTSEAKNVNSSIDLFSFYQACEWASRRQNTNCAVHIKSIKTANWCLIMSNVDFGRFFAKLPWELRKVVSTLERNTMKDTGSRSLGLCSSCYMCSWCRSLRDLMTENPYSIHKQLLTQRPSSHKLAADMHVWSMSELTHPKVENRDSPLIWTHSTFKNSKLQILQRKVIKNPKGHS